MASKQVLVVIVVVAVVTILGAPAPALATELVVGDSQGWRLNVDYNDWVSGNDFIVGDTLVFKYAKGRHTVVQATAASFAACSDDNSLAVWTSGDDRVALDKSGTWWFFCGVNNHCEQGMKFNVTVLPVVKLSSSSASAPALAQGGGVAAGIAGVVVAVVALLF